MSDPFFGLNINNLQTINATNNTRLQQMNHSITKPLMSSHLPQLPQQQMRIINTNSQSETTEEELDERKKFEKYRKFQLQQKRLQEMSFSKTVPKNSYSSADKLMANLIQKVESEAKLDKRINNSHKSGLNVYNQLIAHSSMASNVALSSGAAQTPNSSAYVNQFGSIGQMIPSMYTSGQQLPQQQNNSYFNSFYPSNPTQKTTVQQMTNSCLENINYSQNTADFNGVNRSERGHYSQPIASNQLTTTPMSSSTVLNIHSNSDPIFSITATNGVHPGVTHSNREPIPSVISPSIVRKLPNCFEDLSKTPALYTKVWNYVKTNDISNVCDTNRLYPVLLSVDLPQTTLAKLWSVVNQTIPGQLTRHELNMALALIALIQKSSPNPLEEIYKLDSLPVPNIQFFNESNEIKACFPEVLQISSDLEVKPLSEQILNSNNFEQKAVNQKDYGFSQNKQKNEQNLVKPVIEDQTEDDFDDFKTADFGTISTVNQSVNELTSKLLTEMTVNNSTEDEFDDFKSVTFRSSNQTESPKTQNEVKTNTLSDALKSNASAISSAMSSHTMSPTPVVIVSSLDSMKNSSVDCFENTLGLSPQSNSSQTSNKGSEQTTAFSSNFGSVDKYSVFRELSANDTTKEEDFGNFLSHTTNCDAESVDSLQFGHQDNSDNNDSIEFISHQIIQTCRQIIHKTFNVLVVNHGEDSALEAIRTTDGQKFAFDILEVYGIVKRVEKNLKSSDKLNNHSIKLVEDIDNTWNSISSVFSKASLNIDMKDENSSEGEITSKCVICNSKPSAERPVLTFAGFEYHTSCANLWLNCINPTLPQPLINSR